MKKIYPSLFFLFMFSFSAMSQSFYFRAGTGYGIPIATSSIGEMMTQDAINNNTGTTYTSSVEGIKASYGKGFDFNFAFGYKLNKNFIIDFNLIYLLGSKYETGSIYRYDSGTYKEINDDITTTSAKGLLFNPSVIFSAGFGKAAPYARFGFIAGSPAITSTLVSYTNSDGVDSTIISGKYEKGISFGFQGAVGMNWKLSEKIDLFTEINFIGMTFYPGERTITKFLAGSGNYKVDNVVDLLPNIQESQRKTIYEKEYDPSKVNTDPNQPTTALRESFPFSSLSVQVGIRFNIWTKAE